MFPVLRQGSSVWPLYALAPAAGADGNRLGGGQKPSRLTVGVAFGAGRGCFSHFISSMVGSVVRVDITLLIAWARSSGKLSSA